MSEGLGSRTLPMAAAGTFEMNERVLAARGRANIPIQKGLGLFSWIPRRGSVWSEHDPL